MAKNRSSNDLSAGCLTLFGLPFLCAGLFMSWLYFNGYVQWLSAQRWEETPCWIESAELKTSRGSKGSTSYRATATYRYEYKGREYRGDRVGLGEGSDNVGSFHEKAHGELTRYVVKKSPAAEREPREQGGTPFRCFVNPTNPSESVLYRTLRWEMQAFMAIFALTFPAVGAGLVFGSLFEMRASRRDAKLRENHPGEPWKWKSIWVDGAIPENAGSWLSPLHLYTLWSGLIIVPLMVATAASGAFKQNPSSWLVMIFAALWSLPLWFSIKFLRHRLAAGTTRFEPQETSAWPGGMLRGAICLEKPLPLRGDPEISLRCEKQVTQVSRKRRSITTETLWSHQETVPQDLITRDLSGFRLPVGFTLPADAPESESGEDSDTKHVWKLDLKVPGTPIHSVFEVPVFRTENSPLPQAPSAAVPSLLDEAPADLPALLAARRIHAEFDAAGLPVSIVCPPGRHPSLIIGLAIFDLIWTGAAVFLIQQNAPLIFRIVWPVSATAIWLIVFWNILHKRTVTFSSAGLEVRNQLGPVIWTQTFEKQQITGFSHRTNMSSNNTSFYQVRLESVLGKHKTLVDNLTGSNTAEAVVKRLEAWQKAG